MSRNVNNDKIKSSAFSFEEVNFKNLLFFQRLFKTSVNVLFNIEQKSRLKENNINVAN